MIDTDKYEGCQTSRLILHKGLLCPTIFMDVDGSGKIVPTLDRGIVDVQADIPEHYLHLLQDAPLLLAEVKRLRGQLGQARECLWWCYDLHRFGHEINDEDWNFIGSLLGADMESEEK